MLSAQSSLAPRPEDNSNRNDQLACGQTLERQIPDRDRNTVPPRSCPTRVTTPAAAKIAARSIE